MLGIHATWAATYYVRYTGDLSCSVLCTTNILSNSFIFFRPFFFDGKSVYSEVIKKTLIIEIWVISLFISYNKLKCLVIFKFMLTTFWFYKIRHVFSILGPILTDALPQPHRRAFNRGISAQTVDNLLSKQDNTTKQGPDCICIPY